MRSVVFKIMMAILIVTGLIPVALYFWVFHSGLTQTHTYWGEFGSFLSPIISILAFVGLLYSIELTKDQFQRQSEENRFFNLINLHVNKVNQLTGGENSQIKGVEAFRYYASEFRNLFREKCFDYARSAMAYETDKLPNFAYQFLYKKITREECHCAGKEEIEYVLDYFKRNAEYGGWEVLKGLVNESSSRERKEVQDIGALVFDDSSSEWRIDKLSGLYEDFYDKYGHLLGHYFRNMYYILYYIDETKRNTHFAKIYRAQLSRYELAMLFYNMMGPYTSHKFNLFVFKYNMLDDLYRPDLCYAPHEDRLNADLNALKEMMS